MKIKSYLIIIFHNILRPALLNLLLQLSNHPRPHFGTT